MSDRPRRRRSRPRRPSGHEADLPQGDLAYRMSHAAPNLLPGEVRAHPDPWQYVVVAVVLAVITAVEIARLLHGGRHPRRPHRRAAAAMMVVKFFLVASWFMHLRTDQPVFKRLFIVGAIAAPVLYLVVLATLHGVLAELSRDVLMPAAVAFPRLDAPPRRLAAGRPVRAPATRSRIVRLGPRWAPAGLAGRHPLPGHVLVARRVRDVGGVRLPDPRHRRALQLQRPHGAAPACFTMVVAPLLLLGTAGVAAPAGCSRPRWLFDTVRALSRFIPALVIFNVVLVFTHWPLIVERSAARRARALPRRTRCCSCRR